MKKFLLSVTALATLVLVPTTPTLAVTVDGSYLYKNNCLNDIEGESPLCERTGVAFTDGDVTYDADTNTTTLVGGASHIQDIDVDVEAGDYIVMVALAMAEEVRPDDVITDLPYLYGYQMNSEGFIKEYMQGQNMLLSETESGEWGVVSGVFEVQEDVSTVRFFLNQALRAQTTYSDNPAHFQHPSVFVVSDPTEADRFVDNFLQMRTYDFNERFEELDRDNEEDRIVREEEFVDVRKTVVKPRRVKVRLSTEDETVDKYIVQLRRRYPKKGITKKVRKKVVKLDSSTAAASPVSVQFKKLKPNRKYAVWARPVTDGEKGNWTKQKVKTKKRK